MQIQSNKASQFLEYVKNYSPESQVMRFLNLIDTNRKELALTTADYFLSLCLDKNLIGSYKTIVKKLDLAEDPKYIAKRDALQESVAKAVVDLKKHIVSLSNNVLIKRHRDLPERS
jgi:hypothetical protein